MNNLATSREDLLRISVRLAAEKGFSALGIRDVARLGGVSVGCIYNYFPSKASLLAATVERVWESIFHEEETPRQPEGFLNSVRWMFERLRSGSSQFPDFFAAHTASFGSGEAGEGRQVMTRYFEHIKRGLLQALRNDPDLREDAFSEDFTAEALAGFVFDSLLALFMRQVPDCDFLLAMIRRAVF
ncbi:MAG: TetR/AcrR family transcriptional regulator [Christensenellales bacterium]